MLNDQSIITKLSRFWVLLKQPFALAGPVAPRRQIARLAGFDSARQLRACDRVGMDSASTQTKPATQRTAAPGRPMRRRAEEPFSVVTQFCRAESAV